MDTEQATLKDFPNSLIKTPQFTAPKECTQEPSNSDIIPTSFHLVITEAQDSASPQSSWKLELPNPQPQIEEFNFMCHFYPHWLCVIDLCKHKSDPEECVRMIIPIFTIIDLSFLSHQSGILNGLLVITILAQ